MIKFVLLLLISLPCVAGSFQVLLKDFHGREVHVYLPTGYGQSKATYPVLYMHDGQNLYDPSRAYMGQTWNAEETLNKLIAARLIEPVIVIGIDNLPTRMEDYTPDVDPEEQGGGRAREYVSTIVNELHPLVKKYLRVKGDRNSTAIMGSSLGGLVSLYAGAEFSETFGLVGALSPSIWWNQQSIITLMSNARALPKTLYLDSGTVGGERPQDVQKLAGVIKNRYPGKSLTVVIGEGDAHNEKAWAKRFAGAVMALFSPRRVSKF